MFLTFILFLIILLFIKYRVKSNEAFRKKLVSKLKNLSIIFFMPYWAIITAPLILYCTFASVVSSVSSNDSLPKTIFGVYSGSGFDAPRTYIYPDSTFFTLESTFKIVDTEFDGSEPTWQYIYSEDKILSKGKINVEDRGDFYVLRFIFKQKDFGFIESVKNKLAKDFSSFYYTRGGVNNKKIIKRKIFGEQGLLEKPKN